MPDPKTVRNEIKKRIREVKNLTALKHASVVVNQTSKIPPLRITRKGEGVLIWVNQTGGRIEFGKFTPAIVGTLKSHKDHWFLTINEGTKAGDYSYKMYWQLPGGKRTRCEGNSDPVIIIRDR